MHGRTWAEGEAIVVAGTHRQNAYFISSNVVFLSLDARRSLTLGLSVARARVLRSSRNQRQCSSYPFTGEVLLRPKRVLLICTFAVLVFVGCERSQPLGQTVDTSTDSSGSPGQVSVVPPSQPAIDTTAPTQALTCSPSVLRARDTLTLRMKTPHGDYLTATAPDGTIFFIVYPSLGEPTRKYSLVPSEPFKATHTLRLPAEVRATPRVYGRDTILETVFTQSGTYLLQMGANLESDFSSKPSECRVRFVRNSK